MSATRTPREGDVVFLFGKGYVWERGPAGALRTRPESPLERDTRMAAVWIRALSAQLARAGRVVLTDGLPPAATGARDEAARDLANAARCMIAAGDARLEGGGILGPGEGVLLVDEPVVLVRP